MRTLQRTSFAAKEQQILYINILNITTGTRTKTELRHCKQLLQNADGYWESTGTKHMESSSMRPECDHYGYHITNMIEIETDPTNKK